MVDFRLVSMVNGEVANEHRRKGNRRSCSSRVRKRCVSKLQFLRFARDNEHHDFGTVRANTNHGHVSPKCATYWVFNCQGGNWSTFSANYITQSAKNYETFSVKETNIAGGVETDTIKEKRRGHIGRVSLVIEGIHPGGCHKDLPDLTGGFLKDSSGQVAKFYRCSNNGWAHHDPA
jgi:hypothetical protein